MAQNWDQLETIDPVDLESPQTAGKGRQLWATVVHHPQAAVVGRRSLLDSQPSGRRVALSRLEPTFTDPWGTPGEPLADPHLSRKPIWIAELTDGGVVVDPGENSGQTQVNGVTLKGPRTYPSAAVDDGIVLDLARRVAVLVHHSALGHPHADAMGFVGASEKLSQLRQTLAQVAPLAVPVLLRGETGSGKELAARALHTQSNRASGPFIGVNMAAIPASTAVSELFGHNQGAFTGASRPHPGLFAQADGGTLFLDEVGAASLELQGMLLRTLETGEIRPIGARQQQTVDVRVIAATDEDLEQAIRSGRFRAPLYHRLAACHIEVPPLRERRDDIGRLLVHFLREDLSAAGQKHLLTTPADMPLWLPAPLMSRLVRYDWPGNVRQLRNVARRMALSAQAPTTLGLDLDFDLDEDTESGPGPEPTPETATEQTPRPTVRRAGALTDQEVVNALEAQRWHLARAAKELGISRSSLYALIERSSTIRKSVDIPDDEVTQAFHACGGNVDAMCSQLKVSRRGLRKRLSDLGLTR